MTGLYSYTSEELGRAADDLKEYKNRYRLFLFSGEQGCGKTSLIRALLEGWLGPVPDYCSPTYSIMHEYDIEGIPVFHFDWYRIKHPVELEEAGIPEYLNKKDAYCFIEWPETGMHLLKDLSRVHFFLKREGQILFLNMESHDR